MSPLDAASLSPDSQDADADHPGVSQGVDGQYGGGWPTYGGDLTLVSGPIRRQFETASPGGDHPGLDGSSWSLGADLPAVTGPMRRLFETASARRRRHVYSEALKRGVDRLAWRDLVESLDVIHRMPTTGAVARPSPVDTATLPSHVCIHLRFVDLVFRDRLLFAARFYVVFVHLSKLIRLMRHISTSIQLGKCYLDACLHQTHEAILDLVITDEPDNNNNKQPPFNSLCSGTTRVGKYQKKHSAFCLSIGLCCVQAGFPYLLSSGFLWSRER